jgi:hypothetical protein
MKKFIIFAIASVLLWFPICFGLGAMADVVRLPDTEAWLWVSRILGAMIAACIGWMIVGAKHARTISLLAISVMGIISWFLGMLCLVLAAIAVVMIFVKDAGWLYIHLYDPFLAGAVTIALISVLPLAVLLMIFRATRALGGFILYLLTFFFGFSLWFYALMVAGTHGPGWVIGGLMMCGIGVIITAMIASAISGQWAVAGGILMSLVLIWFAGMLGMGIAESQFEKDNETQAT